jgi:hypothetical protein
MRQPRYRTESRKRFRSGSGRWAHGFFFDGALRAGTGFREPRVSGSSKVSS